MELSNETKTNKIDDTRFIDLELDEGDKDIISTKTNSSSDATKVKNIYEYFYFILYEIFIIIIKLK